MSMTDWRGPCSAVLLAGLLLAACSSSGNAAGAGGGGSFPLTVHAANGAVRIKSRPTAIVSLSPTATEMLYAIGAGKQVKAVDKDSDYPPGVPKTSLDGTSPNVEAIAAYKPDLVVASEDTPTFDHQLAALGIPVLSAPTAVDLAQAYAQFAQLGQATGHQAEATAEVASMQSQISHIAASAPASAKGATYYYELDQTYYSVTSSTFIGQVLGLLGLKDIADKTDGAAQSGGYPQLSGEFILAQQPDYIFLADTLCCGQSARSIAARPGWTVLQAVQQGRVLGLNDDIASRWGPRIVTLLRDVSNELSSHPVKAKS
jgi:iron complex transport system substrate-binding protein